MSGGKKYMKHIGVRWI